MSKMKWIGSGVAGFVLGLLATAWAAGLYTNGLPYAGGVTPPGVTQNAVTSPPTLTYTLPLTGNEAVGADTNLLSGQVPQTEAISLAQILQGTLNSVGVATGNVTLTTAQFVGAHMTAYDNTTLTAAATYTTPTAAAIVAALPAGQAVGYTWMFKLVNAQAGAFALSLLGGTGVTVTGNAAAAAGASQAFLCTVTSVTAVGCQSVGGGL